MGPINRVFNAWVVVRPAEDVEDQWVAHCLDFDVVSQGNSIQQAVHMAGEATLIAVTEDLLAGEDPLLRRAPDEYWETLWETLRHGAPIDPGVVDRKPRSEVGAVAVSMVFGFSASIPPTTKRPSQPEKKSAWETPVAFATSEVASHA